MSYPWHLYVMAIAYIAAGIMHFIKPKMYKRILPRYLPVPNFLVISSGIIEIILGIALCFSVTKNFAVYSIIVMLTFFMPVHFHMLFGKNASMGISKWLLTLRIPLQFILMYWAYSYLAL